MLNAIGRRHSVKDFFDAFALARECGFDNINTDIIAGLPTDTFEGFRKTVEGIISLAPENITLHTLTVKRGADISSEITTHLSNRAVSEMLSFAYGEFEKAGYAPYYLYRQKGTVDNLENTGFCKKGKECLYNVYIMDETHTIIAVGAGGVTKLKDPFTSHIERIPNFKYPYEYNKRFPLICERKEEIRSFYGLFPTDKGT